MEKISVMILEDSIEEKEKLQSVLSNIEYINLAREPKTLSMAMSIIDAESVNVILVSEEFDGDGFSMVEGLTHEYPDRGVIVLTDELKEDTVHKALFSGAKDVILRPYEPSKLLDSIYKVNDSLTKSIKKEKVVHGKNSLAKIGQVFTFFSTKGGVGKTFVSLNFAVSLIRETKKKVVLVDFDLGYGSGALALNLTPRYSIIDVINDIRNIDADFLESYLTVHNTGLKILPANLDPKRAEMINAEHLMLIIKTLQSSYDYVVVDMPSSYSEVVKPAISYADKLFMVVLPEISSIRSTKSSLVYLNELNYPKSKIHLVLNKRSRKDDIKSKDVEKTLDQSISFILDADHRKVPYTLNQGIPYVERYTRSAISKGMKKFILNMSKN